MVCEIFYFKYFLGLEFFIGTSAWYCKLCDTWIGDLHCASAHFKSKRHNDLYAVIILLFVYWFYMLRHIKFYKNRTRITAFTNIY